MDGRTLTRAVALGCLAAAVTGTAAAHGGLAGGRPGRLAVPTWLFVSTGGAVVGLSVLLASFVTERDLVNALDRWHVSLARFGTRLDAASPVHRRGPPGSLGWGQVVGLLALTAVVVTGFLGPQAPLGNAAVLLVWVGWWVGYAASTYLVGNTWPAVDPFRALARPLGDGLVGYPDRLGSWPAIAGLFALVWAEIASPVTASPRWLAVATVGYLLVTLAGAALVGSGAWFRHVDPLAAAFRSFGSVAPLSLRDGELRVSLPGAAAGNDWPADRGTVAFVVALVWVTTFDGLVGTALWATHARTLVGAGLPAAALYPVALLVGFAAYALGFALAVRAVRRVAPTCRSPDRLARAFAPSLAAVAAGYHLAHNLGYFLSYLPALARALTRPFGPAAPTALSVPGWVGALSVGAVVGGHLLAVWLAHGAAYDLFPSRVQAVRSHLPTSLLMVLYTVVSLWIVTQPYSQPPYL